MADHVCPWQGKRVLVTGCADPLGGSVARELASRGAEVVAMIRERPVPGGLVADLGPGARFIHGRVDNVFRLHSAMAVHEVAAVFHLPADGADADGRATKTLREAAKLYSRCIPIVAARRHRPLAIAQEETAGERITVVRFGEVFGPGDPAAGHVVSMTASALVRGAGATLPADGPARDFVYAPDAAAACLLAAESTLRDGPADLSFFSGWRMTERQMAAAVRDVHAGRSVEAPDSAPQANLLGWRPKHTLAEALRDALAWHCEVMRVPSPQGERAAA
jgi:nucleoside-diphosphate-sugar epimerase